jgi:hypothetical protein
VAIATKPIEVSWTTYEKGTVAGLRHWVSAISDGKPVVTGRVNWYMGVDLEPNWVPEGCTDVWLGRVAIEGEPGIEAEVRLGRGSLDDPKLRKNDLHPALVATAMGAVNAIPAVCAAEPGIRTYLDLPLFGAHRAFGS